VSLAKKLKGASYSVRMMARVMVVAIYHIPTDTLHMHDPLKIIDLEKVRDEIRRYLERGNGGL